MSTSPCVCNLYYKINFWKVRTFLDFLLSQLVTWNFLNNIRTIGEPIGKYFKIEGKKIFTPNVILETQYRENAVLSESIYMVINFIF